MRWIALVLPIALFGVAAAQTVESPGRKLRPFSVLGSDGRKYDLKSLPAGKPVFVVNLTESGFPLA